MIVRWICRSCGTARMVHVRRAYNGVYCRNCRKTTSTRERMGEGGNRGAWRFGIGAVAVLAVVGVAVLLVESRSVGFEDRGPRSSRSFDTRESQRRFDRESTVGERTTPEREGSRSQSTLPEKRPTNRRPRSETNPPNPAEAALLARRQAANIVSDYYDGGIGITTEIFEDPVYDSRTHLWTIPVKISWQGAISSVTVEIDSLFGAEDPGRPREYWVQGDLVAARNEKGYRSWTERRNGKSRSLETWEATKSISEAVLEALSNGR